MADMSNKPSHLLARAFEMAGWRTVDIKPPSRYDKRLQVHPYSRHSERNCHSSISSGFHLTTRTNRVASAGFQTSRNPP